jgi:hypothetical protein
LFVFVSLKTNTMPYVENWDEFSASAEKMYAENPLEAGFTFDVFRFRLLILVYSFLRHDIR